MSIIKIATPPTPEDDEIWLNVVMQRFISELRRTTVGRKFTQSFLLNMLREFGTAFYTTFREHELTTYSVHGDTFTDIELQTLCGCKRHTRAPLHLAELTYPIIKGPKQDGHIIKERMFRYATCRGNVRIFVEVP